MLFCSSQQNKKTTKKVLVIQHNYNNMRWIYGFEMSLRNLKGLGIYEKINKNENKKSEDIET